MRAVEIFGSERIEVVGKPLVLQIHSPEFSPTHGPFGKSYPVVF